MIPTVAVQVPEAPRPYAAAMIDACTATLPRGRCERTRDETEPPTAVASVAWGTEERLVARVEVAVEREGRKRWLTQTIEFAATDPEVERWRVVGITVATLAGELEAPTPPQAPAEAGRAASTAAGDGSARDSLAPAGDGEVGSSAPRDASASSAPLADEGREAAGHAGGWVSAGAAAWWVSDAWRAGAWARGTLVPIRPLFLTVAATVAERPTRDGLGLTWASASAGVGAVWGLDEWQLAGRVEGLLERVRASRVGDGADVGAATTLGGLRMGADATWPANRPFSLTVGLDWEQRYYAVDVLLDERVVELPATTLGAVVGVRWTP